MVKSGEGKKAIQGVLTNAGQRGHPGLDAAGYLWDVEWNMPHRWPAQGSEKLCLAPIPHPLLAEGGSQRH